MRGESQDHSRIIRLSYHTPGYVELARHAYRAWAEVERDAGEQLVLKTGGLDFGPRQSAIPLSNYSDSMDAAGVPYERLDAAEIMRRWPQFSVTDDIHGLYQPESGIAMAARGNAAHIRMARAHGATIRDNAPVESIRPSTGEFEVTAGGTAYRCRRLVIAAGAWSNRALAPLGVKLPLRITKEQVTYFGTPHQAEFAPDRFPIWIWMDDPCFYGFPTFGEAGPKAGQDAGGLEVTADTRNFDVDQAALDRVVRFSRTVHSSRARADHLHQDLPLYADTRPRLRRSTWCRAIRGRQWPSAAGTGSSSPRRSVGCFPISPSRVGPITTCRPFRIDRPILKLDNPPRNYMV